MPKSKLRKDHKKKVNKRNELIKKEKELIQKKQRELIMNLIEQEKQRGLFENIPTFDLPKIDSDSPQIQGPII